jgi:hypothetical protein
MFHSDAKSVSHQPPPQRPSNHESENQLAIAAALYGSATVCMGQSAWLPECGELKATRLSFPLSMSSGWG